MPRSTRFDDIYYSEQDALRESIHVFIEGSGLRELWNQGRDSNEHYVVAELGFGGGLNFLNTWAEWRKNRSIPDRKGQLHYIALENFPLSAEQLQRLHQHWPSLGTYSQKLGLHYNPAHRGLQRIRLEPDVCLDLVIEDAYSYLAKRPSSDPKVDVWFLDGFSPAKNPDLWTGELFEMIVSHSDSRTRAATYSSAGFVRRNLEQAGFEVERITGFGDKRHMLKASQPTSPKSTSNSAPWFQIPGASPHDKSAVVIGAGLAGCFTAYGLASRGWKIDLVDSESAVASGASGIAQLALRCRLFNEANPLSRFYLQAYSYALSLLWALNRSCRPAFHQSGLLQQVTALNRKNSLRASAINQLYPPEIVSLNADGDFWFPEGGWVDSGALCKGLIDHKEINFLPNTKIHALQKNQNNWRLLDGNENVLSEAPVVVLANGSAAAAFKQSAKIPLQSSYGQSSQFSGELLSTLEHVVCADKSIFPAQNGVHTVSATYRQASESGELRKEDDAENQRSLEQILNLPAGSVELKQSLLGGRCHSRDRYPVVGPVPDFAAMSNDFAELSRNARANVTRQASYQGGLYINTGHGSNGLSSCPLSGEYLASLICGDSSPLNEEAMQALHPARFLIQDLKKQRV